MNDPLRSDAVFIPSEKVVPRKIRDKRIIVPIEDGVADFSDAMFSLNSTGNRIWECIEEKKSVGEICNTLIQEYDAPAEQIEQGVRKLMSTLIEKGIICPCRS